MNDNNPFRPTLAQPADDSALATDPAADNFLDSPVDNSQGNFNAPAVSLDNMVAPSDGDNANPVNFNNSDYGVNGMTSQPDQANQLSNATPDSNYPNSTTEAGANQLDGNPTADVSVDNNNQPESEADVINSADDAKTNPTSHMLNQLSNQADNSNEPIDIAPKGKQLTISLLTIVFCVLFVISTALAIFFFIKNNQNASELADTKAKLEEISDKNGDSSTSTRKTSSQFDALQDKIADLTKKGEEKQKLLDENKKSIDALTKDKTDLTAKLNEAQKKISADSNLNKNVNSMITTLCTNESYKDSAACVASRPNNSQPSGEQPPAAE